MDLFDYMVDLPFKNLEHEGKPKPTIEKIHTTTAPEPSSSEMEEQIINKL